MSMVKGVAVGMIAGACLGYAGKSAADDNPKIRKKYAASSAPWAMWPTRQNICSNSRHAAGSAPFNKSVL